MRDIVLNCDYTPSSIAQRFHESDARFRFMIWGIKSGKTLAGVNEFIRVALSMPGEKLSWVVAPTYTHLQVIERGLVNALHKWPGMIVSRNRNNHEIELRHGGLIQLKSAEWPDGLRGPNVDYAWLDEAGYIKREAWWIILERIAATEGDVTVTTTPHGRNWVWQECRAAGLPPDAPYGEFQSEDGTGWVSHYATEDFPWVKQKEIQKAKDRMPWEIFEQEYGAKFLSELTSVFRYIPENMTLQLPPEKVEEPVIMGLDLAKYQDYTAEIIMGRSGRIYEVDRWTRVDWSIQRARIEGEVKKWNCSVVLDKSNIGSVIEEDLRRVGIRVIPMEMNVPGLKLELVQALQIAFERRDLKIPNPSLPSTPKVTKNLLDELEWFECTLTRGGRQSFSAPSGLTDDLVISLALANWGRVKYLGSGAPSADVVMARRDWDKVKVPKTVPQPRLKRYNRLFGRPSRLGLAGPTEPFWGG